MPNQSAAQNSASRSIEDRIRAIEDRLEILNLIASHPPSADSGADHFTRQVYTDDGVIDLGGGKTAIGNAEVAGMVKTPGHQAAIAGGLAGLALGLLVWRGRRGKKVQNLTEKDGQ